MKSYNENEDDLATLVAELVEAEADIQRGDFRQDWPDLMLALARAVGAKSPYPEDE